MKLPPAHASVWGACLGFRLKASPVAASGCRQRVVGTLWAKKRAPEGRVSLKLSFSAGVLPEARVLTFFAVPRFAGLHILMH